MTRTATYTTPAADEVHLRFPQPGGPDAGKPADQFYPTAEYERRQQKHGRKLYPQPTTPKAA